MALTLDQLAVGNKAIIKTYDPLDIPLKLIEMGCIEGNEVFIVQLAPLNDPIYLNINDTFLAIRKEVAAQIQIETL